VNATAQKKIVPNKVLVTGASGLLGVAAIEKFLSAGWDVVGVSRRKPELPSGRDVQFLSVDLRDEEAARAAFERLTDVTHVAYTALHEKPELVAGWSSKEQIETNNAMLRNVVEPIVRAALNLQHISILRRSTACTCARSPSQPANVMPVRTTRTSSSTMKTMCVR
jgi:nucleoside-diphosphate-sugar epimerase